MSYQETIETPSVKTFKEEDITDIVPLDMIHINAIDILNIIGSSRKKHRIVCTNCGNIGHDYRVCHNPISSFGIININILPDCSTENDYFRNENEILISKLSTKKKMGYRIFSQKYPDIECIVNPLHGNKPSIKANKEIRLRSLKTSELRNELKKIIHYQNKILFMMVSRKYSLGYIEFLWGKYRVTDSNAIIKLFSQMYQNEIDQIKTASYDDLVYEFSNRDNESRESVLSKLYRGRYSVVYCEAKIKFEMLRNPSDEQKKLLPATLDFYASEIKPKWSGPEWGFPKGRREEYGEDNIACAQREFQEETGYEKEDYTILNRVEPLEEIMEGTNGVPYRHVYYLSVSQSEITKTPLDSHEIGNVAWFTYQEAMDAIRPYHTNKKYVLTQAFIFIVSTLVNG
jgi:8-oxo-dGTP pyrophosphatase MutT (NUDIX family)